MSDIRHLPEAPTHTLIHPHGDVVERHRHDDHQLIYVSSGVSAIRTERGAWVASSARALWVPAQTWHEHRFYGHSSFHTIGFPTTCAPLATEAPAVIAVDPLLRELVIALTSAGTPGDEASRMRAVLDDRLHRATETPFNLPTASDPRLAAACRLVEDDLAQPRSLRWLATRVGAGERTLSRLFRSEFGMTYPQWRTRTRVFAAMILLAEGATVTHTAHSCGWATTSAFIDTFVTHAGSTPGAYRTTAGGRHPVTPG